MVSAATATGTGVWAEEGLFLSLGVKNSGGCMEQNGRGLQRMELGRSEGRLFGEELGGREEGSGINP